MSITDGSEVLKNYMEDCVEDMLHNMIRDRGFNTKLCVCEQCRIDMMAIALSRLPTKYIVTRKGELYAKLNTLQNQFEVDIIAALTQASVIVGNNPRHGA